jgi:N-acetylmuramoyl-L-alanine amidase
LTTTVDGDASSQAQAANRFQADVYVGFEIAADSGCTIYFYEVPTFFSAGGRNLALRIAGAMRDRSPELSVRVQGLRHPVLRETRMPAVLCSLAPIELVALKTSAISAAVNDALDAWRQNPSLEI